MCKKTYFCKVYRTFKIYFIPFILFSSIVFYGFYNKTSLGGKYVISYFLDDPLLNMAILKHNMDIFLTHSLSNLWHMPIFYPYKLTLAFSENLLPQSVFLLPVYTLTGHNIVQTYNIAILLSFIALAFNLYVASYYYTKNIEASILAAIFFAFSPFFITHLSHFQVISAFWLPLIFLGIHKAFKENNIKYIALASVLYVLQSASCMYYLVITPIFVIIHFAVYYYYNPKNTRFFTKALLLFFFISIIPIFLLITPYLKVTSLYGLERTLREIRAYSPTILSFILPPPCTLLDFIVKTFVKNIPRYNQARLYMGILPSIFLIFALIFIEKNIILAFKLKERTYEDTHEYAPVLIIKKHPYPAFIKAYWWSFWVSLSLALGITLFGSPIPNPLYALFYKFYPGAAGLRDPSRFFAITIMSCAIFIAYFYNTYSKNKKRVTIFILLLIYLLLEFLPKTAPVRKMPYGGKLPEAYKWIMQNTNQKDRLMEFPLVELFYQQKIFCRPPDSSTYRKGFFYTYYTVFHKKDIFNGYSGYFSPFLIYALISSPKTQLSVAKYTGIRYIVIHKDIYQAIEEISKQLNMDQDPMKLLKLENNREELLKELENLHAEKVYEDSMVEIYKLKNINEAFAPEKAYLSFCKTSISAKMKNNRLNLYILNRDSHPCVLLYREKIRLEIGHDGKTIYRKNFFINPGTFPPFLQRGEGFVLPIQPTISPDNLPVNVKVFVRQPKQKEWKKLGEYALQR